MPPIMLDGSEWPMRLRARVMGASNGAYRDPATGDVSDLDYSVLSDCLASALSQPLRASQFPPRNHYVVEASLGPGSRPNHPRATRAQALPTPPHGVSP
eukprot:425359-Pyramimonas_sp.AAC.1